MQFREFKACDPGTSGYAARITKKEWEKYRPYLTKLHEKGLTRLDIIRTAAQDHQFRPSYGQLNGKFREWGLKVYSRSDLLDKTESTTPASELSAVTSYEASADDFNFQSLQLDESPASYSKALAQASAMLVSSWPDQSQLYTGSETDANHPRSYFRGPSQDFIAVDNERPGIERVESIDTFLSSLSSAANSTSGLFFADFDGAYPDDRSEQTLATLKDTQNIQSSLTATENESNFEDSTGNTQSLPSASEELDVSSIVSLWSQRVGCRVDEASLRATFYLAAAFHSTQLFAAAFELWKHTYICLSRTSQHDDISRLGALVHCARSACNDQAVSFVQSHISETVTWCDQKWTTEDMDYGQGLYSYLLSLQAGLTKTPSSTSNAPKDSDCMCALIGLRKSPKDFGYQLFSHVVASKDQPDPMFCVSLAELLCCLLTACLQSFRPPRPRFEATFAGQSWCNVEDKWSLIRQIAIYLLSTTEIKDLADLLQDRSSPCKCGRCESMALLFESSPLETFIAVALMIVDRIESLFGPFTEICDTDHVHLGGTIPLDRAVNSLLSEMTSFESYQDIYNSISSLRDFLSFFQSRFEAYFVGRKTVQTSLSAKVTLQMMDAVCGQVPLTPRNRSYSDSSITLKIRSSTRPARQWFRKLSAPTPPSANISPQLNDNSGMKRPRSAVSSMRTSNVSRSSSMRSFEHLAKRLKERSSLSAKSNRSKHSHLTRSSSQGSWNFAAVTGLAADIDESSKPIPHRIDEEHEELGVDEAQSLASGVVYPQHLESSQDAPTERVRSRSLSQPSSPVVNLPQNSLRGEDSTISRASTIQRKAVAGNTLVPEPATAASTSSVAKLEPLAEEDEGLVKLHNKPVMRVVHF